MTEYRVTRPQLYGPGTIGHLKPGARQGHYAHADSPEEAAKEVGARFNKMEILDVQTCWDGNADGTVLRFEPGIDGVYRLIK